MTGSCNGICTRFEYKRKRGVSPYECGIRRCQICGLFLNKLDGLRCPCCHFLTRGVSHHPNRNKTARLENIKYDIPTLQLNENLRT